MSDSISRADAIEAVLTYFIPRSHTGERGEHEEDFVRTVFNALPSAEPTKKKAELKENGDWDCPDVYCDECDHHRSVEWCSLAIPNHEEIDDTYKMVNEAFFEGFNVAEKQYRLLIKTVEGIDKKSAEAADVYKAHEEEHLEIVNRIKELQYAIAKTQTIVGKMVESAEADMRGEDE